MLVKFQPPILAIFATILLVSVFIALGKWQLNRADEKTEIHNQYTKERSQEPVALITQFENIELWRYKNVYINGTPLPNRQFLLDNQIRNSRPGYNVITPFKLDDNRIVLVDRGWIPIGLNRNDIQDISIAAAPMRIEGYLYTPYGEAFTLGGIDEGQTTWPRIISHLDFATLSIRLNTTLEPLTIRMHPNQDLGFQRDWPIMSKKSSDIHIAYAVQWFALALAVFVLFLLLNIKFKK